MLGTYTKGITMALTILVIAGTAIASASGLGLSSVAVAWIATLAGIGGTVLTVLSPNANQPTIPPGHVIVAQQDAKPGAIIVAQRAPAS